VSEPGSWREALSAALIVFVIALVGGMAAFALWLRDLDAPSVTFLGSGDQLSVLVTDGPARLILATGDDPINYENALARVRPIFARRVDVLLLAGDDRSLLVPVAARAAGDVRHTNALAPLPPSPETDALGPVEAFAASKRIQLGPTIGVTVETMLPVGADPKEEFPVWRATIERGETRVVILSDGDAAALFPPGPPAAVLAVSGADPVAGWDEAPAVALVANADEVSGPDLRAALAGSRRPPEWYGRVHAGEALRLRFVRDGIVLPADAVLPLAAGQGSPPASPGEHGAQEAISAVAPVPSRRTTRRPTRSRRR
jgi:hypothetical protein